MKKNSNQIILTASLLALSLVLPARAADEIPPSPQRTASGMIESIDKGRHSLEVKNFEASLSLHVAEDAVITTTNAITSTFDNLKIGDYVEVSYDQFFLAHVITQISAKETKPASGPMPPEDNR